MKIIREIVGGFYGYRGRKGLGENIIRGFGNEMSIHVWE